MNEVVQFLTENRMMYLATVGLDGKAKCRPFMFCFERDGKLWFATDCTKKVYKEIEANPFVEFSVFTPAFVWIRVNGKVVVEDNKAVKEDCMQFPPILRFYQTADNPIFRVFYLADAKAVIADVAGSPPKEYSL